MELRQLRYFLAVADSRSFVSAAQALYISRQAISKAIAQLEEELRVRLFMRDSNGAFLTPAGIMFYDRVRPVLLELDGIHEEMRCYGRRYQQRVRLAFSIGTLQLYEQRLLDFRSGQKNVRIEYAECSEESAAALLLENRADMVVCTTKPKDTVLSGGEIYRSRWGVLLREQKDLQELESIELQDLSWFPLAGLPNQQGQANFGPLQYSGYDYHRLFALTQQGKCALLLPECLIPEGMSHVRWLPFAQEQWWTLYQVHLQSLEKSLLYRSILDELQIGVFEAVAQSGGGSHE